MNYINSLGLIFDIIGVLILFKYGLPSNVSKNGEVGMTFLTKDNEDEKKYKKYKFRSNIGLIIIIIGFILQIISNHYFFIF